MPCYGDTTITLTVQRTKVRGFNYTFDFIFKRVGISLQKLKMRKTLRILFSHAGETVYFLHMFFSPYFLFNAHINYHSV